MNQPDFTILYVADPLKSAEFYSKLWGIEPVDSAPGFVLFVLANKSKFGLWLKTEVEPAPTGGPGSSEICLSVETEAGLHELHRQCQGQGIPILQAPSAMDFGLTFVIADPDGHRLRVFKPA